MATRASTIFRGGVSIPPLGYTNIAGDFIPHFTTWNTASFITTNATRLYYFPFYFADIIAFTGLKTYNGGAGDNGDTFRMGVYEAAITTGGLRGLPSTRLVDAGEVTLTAAAAYRTLATSFTPTYIGWHWLAFHANQAASMSQLQMITNTYGLGGGPTNGGADFPCLYVDTAYGALASTAVTPTARSGVAPAAIPYI